jgi:hypothetical protein
MMQLRKKFSRKDIKKAQNQPAEAGPSRRSSESAKSVCQAFAIPHPNTESLTPFSLGLARL